MYDFRTVPPEGCVAPVDRGFQAGYQGTILLILRVDLNAMWPEILEGNIGRGQLV